MSASFRSSCVLLFVSHKLYGISWASHAKEIALCKWKGEDARRKGRKKKHLQSRGGREKKTIVLVRETGWWGQKIRRMRKQTRKEWVDQKRGWKRGFPPCFMWFKECILLHPVFIECLSGSACVLEKRGKREKGKEDTHTLWWAEDVWREKKKSGTWVDVMSLWGFLRGKRSSEWWMDGMEWEREHPVPFLPSSPLFWTIFWKNQRQVSPLKSPSFCADNGYPLSLFVLSCSYSASNWLPAVSLSRRELVLVARFRF